MEVHSRSSNGTPLFERICKSCGKISIVDSRKLNKTCLPCANKSRSTHGLSPRSGMHPLYKLLHNMKSRCMNPSAAAYKYYGGRGISVCEEWAQDTPSFVEWALKNGWSAELEIDRIDTNGNYSPENCRFVTHKQNSQTRRSTKTTEAQARLVKKLLAGGASVKEASSEAGVSYMSAWHIKSGKSWSDS